MQNVHTLDNIANFSATVSALELICSKYATKFDILFSYAGTSLPE